jgi:hypothetical protein
MAEAKTKTLFIPATVIADAYKAGNHVGEAEGLKFKGVEVSTVPGGRKGDEIGEVIAAIGIDGDGIEERLGRRRCLPGAKSLKAVG